MTKFVSAAEVRGNRIPPSANAHFRIADEEWPSRRRRTTRTDSRRQILTLEVGGRVEDAANELLAAAWRGDFTPTRWRIPSDLWLRVLCTDDAARMIGLAELPIDTRTYMGLPVDVASGGGGVLALEAAEAIPL
jgi:hypothetical protein